MRDQVKELLEQGLTGAEIARRLGVSETRISRLARRLGYQGHRKKPVQYDWTAIRTYYDNGHTMHECKRRFGFSNGAWDNAVSRGDIEPRRDRGPRAPGLTHHAVKRLLEEGRTVAEIARELGIKKGTVCYHRRRLGYPMDERCNRRYDWAEVNAPTRRAA
jgi:DNA-binding CsgD family transcriptional regulator